MKRLTKVMYCDDGNKLYDYSNEVIRKIKDFSSRLELMFEKLAEYEDADEQGLLLKLPCKIGDTLYFIYHNEVHHEEVKRFFQCNGGKNWGIVLWGMYPDLYFDQIGKTVFLTKEEAEQKLKEMESD